MIVSGPGAVHAHTRHWQGRPTAAFGNTACAIGDSGLSCGSRRNEAMSNESIIRQKISEAGPHLVSVHFIKADGTERQMTFNPLHKGQVLGTGHPIKDPVTAANNFKVMDIKKNAWRSFDARRVFKIRVNGQVTDLPLEIDAPRA